MMVSAETESYAFAVRDDFYDMAIRYYELAGADGQRRAAEAAQRVIQPQLQAEQQRREEALDAAADRMSDQAAKMEAAAEKMRKTEAEQEAFKEEADALEKELGF